MTEQDPQRALALSDHRERTIRTLIDRFAEDHLTVEEFENRLDAAHRALRPAELDALTADLPIPAPTQTATQPTTPPKPVARPQTTPATDVRENQVLVAVMGGVEKKGRWTPARRTLVFAFMGGAELDFREAIMPEGVTEVHIFTIWGGVEILVPPGTRVDSSGVAIMGAFEHVPGPGVEDPDAPTLRITGLALMAGVEVHVRYAGESARDARERRREEQRRLREERKRLRGQHGG
jgi:hypothetical protein